MILVLIFGVALLASVLVSGLAARTVLSTSLLFLAAGVIIGPAVPDLVEITPDSGLVSRVADIALFTVLFTDGTRMGLSEIKSASRGAGRALLVGLPLTWIGIAGLTVALTDLDWISALLVGAVLAPTDPVFASAIISRPQVPWRLRRLLNVESGLNDGLALPLVIVLSSVSHGGGLNLGIALGELAIGAAIGVLIPLIATSLVRLPTLGSSPRLQPLGPFAVGIILYAVAHIVHGNPYIAAFIAGSTTATIAPIPRDAFEELGDLLAELTKFAALLAFGALLSPQLFTGVSVGGWVVAVLALVLVRPVALVLSLLGVHMSRRSRFAIAWFGPKGFSSVVYGLLILDAVPRSHDIFAIVAVTITLSIVAHSSTDVPVARLFDVEDQADVPDDDPGPREEPSRT